MNQKIFALALTTLLLAVCLPAEAQQATKVVAYFTAAPLSAIKHRTEAFRQGLRDVGYIEGKSIFIEWRSADGKLELLPALAAELIQRKVDIIVTAGGAVTRPVKDATSTIPIVMAQDQDPIGNGFVASLARPGGNITGLSALSPELGGKRLEILKEVVPNLSRVAVFGTSTSLNSQLFKEIEIAARAFGVKLQYLDVLTSKDIEPAFHAARKGRADAVLDIVSGPIGTGQRKEIAALAIKSRLPIMLERPIQVETGGLMSYGVHLPDLDRRAATYVDKILKGAKPADLPVEQPTKFEFVINLK